MSLEITCLLPWILTVTLRKEAIPEEFSRHGTFADRCLHPHEMMNLLNITEVKYDQLMAMYAEINAFMHFFAVCGRCIRHRVKQWMSCGTNNLICYSNNTSVFNAVFTSVNVKSVRSISLLERITFVTLRELFCWTNYFRLMEVSMRNVRH